MKRMAWCLKNRPHTTTTIYDIRRMFKNHPIKTTLALPVASLLLGCQIILFYTTIPFIALNRAVGNY